jgi:hypothetical protein
MKTSRVQAALSILKESFEDASVKGKRAPKPEPTKSKKTLLKVKKVRKN